MALRQIKDFNPWRLFKRQLVDRSKIDRVNGKKGIFGEEILVVVSSYKIGYRNFKHFTNSIHPDKKGAFFFCKIKLNVKCRQVKRSCKKKTNWMKKIEGGIEKKVYKSNNIVKINLLT